jgi:hypothetical protein
MQRRRELAMWVYEQWYTRFMRNPFTERGLKYLEKDYNRLMVSLSRRFDN